ncbi:MAG TPA: hypothetical protein PKG52_03295 [bacterium]|nr:hypothetical protein [bacterium]HPS29645.1 hypothetical protein [bacterium]
MNKTVGIIIAVIFAILLIQPSCNRKKTDSDLTLSQNDIDLLIKHKSHIDQITGKYDRELQKARRQMKTQIIEKGKSEINKYLESNDIDPVTFMRKSKKILKGYLAFYETSPESLEKKIKMLDAKELTQKEFDNTVAAYKKADEELFKEYTADLSDYEIELIKMNVKNLFGMMNSSSSGNIQKKNK